MRKYIHIICLLFFIFNLSISGQEKDTSHLMSYDEIIDVINKKDVSFIEKYWLDYDHLGYEDRVKIFKKLLPYAKKEKDKKYLIKIYCNIYTNLTASSPNISENKLYLDSAYVYIDQTDDANALGNVNFQLGLYYSSQPNSEEIAHSYFYKAIPYFEKSKNAYYYLNFIYFGLASTYVNREDVESLRKIVKKMLALKMEGDNRIFLLNIYAVTANYYSILKKKDSINSTVYLDSSIYYRKQAVILYETLKDSIPNLKKSNGSISSIYTNLALEMGNKDNPDWKEIMNYLEKGGDNIVETNYQGKVNYLYVKGTLLNMQKKYDEALITFKEEEKLLNTSEEFDASDDHYAQLYNNLSVTYENKEDYKNALAYERKAGILNLKLNDIKRYETIKELDTKYETKEKEVEISRLNEEKQKTQLKTTLILSVSIFLILMFFLAFLYNRIKRLKKEKEAILLKNHMIEKENEYQIFMNETEQRLTKRYLEGRESERERVSKELHDNVANNLFLLERELSQIDNIPSSVPKQIEELYTHTRNLSHDLMAPSFQFVGLHEILYDYLEESKEHTGINFNLEIDSDDTLDHLPESYSHEIYRIVQECVGNIIKHASAKNALISLQRGEDTLILSIQDDGCGFNSEDRTRGIGLENIRNRTKALNGNIDIISQKGEGCQIRVTIPLNR